MPTLYFIRHAKTSMNTRKLWSGRTDCSVTPEGARMAKKAFGFTADDFNVFYCSPLKRTCQTLNAIIPNHPEPIIDSRIIERDFGSWEGYPYNILSVKATEQYIKGKINPPDGESYSQVHDRVVEFVNDMFSTYRGDEKILVVTHATVCRMVRDVFLPNMEKGPIGNAQLLVLSEEDWRNQHDE